MQTLRVHHFRHARQFIANVLLRRQDQFEEGLCFSGGRQKPYDFCITRKLVAAVTLGGIEMEQQKLRSQTIEQAGVSKRLRDEVRIDRDSNIGKGAVRASDGYAHRGLLNSLR